jgi:hypothetical protein
MTFHSRGMRSSVMVRALSWALTGALTLSLPGTGLSLAFGSERGHPADLSVGSDPVGAQVYVDGKLRGETPLTVERVSAGDHRVTVAKDGFLENSRVVTVAAGQGNSLRVNLTPSGRASNALMQVEPGAEPPTSAPPVAAKKGGGGGKVVLIALGVAAAGAGGYLLLKPKNSPPTVSFAGATPTGTAIVGVTSVSLAANGSDPDKDSLTYTWDFGDGSTPVTGGATVQHVFLRTGSLTVSVTVSDGKKSATATGAVPVGTLAGDYDFYIDGAIGSSRHLVVQQQGATFTGTFYFGSSAYASANGTVSSPRAVVFTESFFSGGSMVFRGEATGDLARIEGTSSGQNWSFRRK